MKDIFILNSVTTKLRNDGDIDLAISLKTQLAPTTTVELMEELSLMIGQQINTTLELRQAKIPS